MSLSLKDLTDSEPEPSSVERLGGLGTTGPVSGFKWESSVGGTLHTARLP